MRPIEMNATWVTAVRAVECCLKYMGEHGFRDYRIYLVAAALLDETPKRWRIRKGGRAPEYKQLIVINGRTPGGERWPGYEIHAQVDMTPFRDGTPSHERNLRITMRMRWLGEAREPVTRGFICGETGHVPREDKQEALPFVA